MQGTAFSGVRVRLIALVLLAVLPALGLILYIAHHHSREALSAAREQMHLFAYLVAADYTRLVDNTHQLLTTLARLPEIRDDHGQSCNTLMGRIKSGYAQYANLGAIRPDGTVFCSAHPQQGPVNASDRSFFRKALATREFSIGEYQVGRITGKPVVVLAYPDYDSGAHLRAVVFAAVDLAWLNSLMQEEHLPEGLTLTLLDSRGMVLNRYPEPEKWGSASRAGSALFRAMRATRGEGTVEDVGLDGIRRIYAFTPLRHNSSDGGAFIAIGIPRHVVYAGADRTLIMVGTGLALVTILVLLAAWYGGDAFLLRRLTALVSATQRLARGEAGARSGIRDGAREITQLAHSFDDMAETIERRDTDLRHSALIFKESEERFRSLVETTSDWIWEVDAHGVYTYASPKVRDLLGYAPEEVLGKTPFDFMPPEEVERVGPAFGEIAAAQRPFERLENINLHKDGRRVVIETNGVPLFDREGRFAGYRGVDRDITARKQAETALVESEAKLRTVSESAQDAILMIDERGQITFWNQAAETMFGYRREEALGKDMAGLIIPHKMRETHNQGLGAFRHTGQGAAIGKVLELPSQRRDGSEFVAEHSISAVKLEGKWHAVGIVRDVTARKQAEEAFRKTHELLENIFSSVHTLIAYLDTDFNFIRVNRAYAEADARTPEFFSGKNHFALYPHAENEAIFRQVLETGVPYTTYAKPFTYPDHPERGTTYWDWSLQPVRDPGGKISGLVLSLANVTDRIRAQERIQFLAYHDELTGLPNRALLLDRVKQAVIEAQRHGRQAAVICLDIDRFKFVNEAHGHVTGDALLKAAADRLSACVRPGDTVARLGGDEFAVALSDVAHPDDIGRVVQKIMRCADEPLAAGDNRLFVTLSVGITLFPLDGDDPETLLKNAAVAMHQAKQRGGNSYQYFSAQMAAMAAEHLVLENSLRLALERREFVLHYQPQISLYTGAVTGVEALIRWRHPEKGLISPAKFIPLAEETGLIVPIGDWVLATACAQMRAWREAGLPPLRVAVNLSTQHFKQPGLDETIRRILRETGADSRWLDIELTESTLAQNPDMIADILYKLEQLDVQISVDDFGTGYSSLSYLKRFPVDVLKIDQSFVRGVVTDPDDAALVMAIIGMAHALRIQTLAEGVETKEQLEFLHKHHCDAMQGYYFSKPLPAEDVTVLLREGRRLELPKT